MGVVVGAVRVDGVAAGVWVGVAVHAMSTSGTAATTSSHRLANLRRATAPDGVVQCNSGPAS